jgi:hypothetical protein
MVHPPGQGYRDTDEVKPDNNTGWIVQVSDKVNAADMTLYVCVNQLASSAHGRIDLNLGDARAVAPLGVPGRVTDGG